MTVRKSCGRRARDILSTCYELLETVMLLNHTHLWVFKLVCYELLETVMLLNHTHLWVFKLVCHVHLVYNYSKIRNCECHKGSLSLESSAPYPPTKPVVIWTELIIPD